VGVFVFRFLKALRLAQEENADSGWRWIDPVAWLSWMYYHLFLVLSAPLRRHQELRADGWSAAAYGGDFAAVTLLRDWLLAQQFDDALARFFRAKSQHSEVAPTNLFREFSTRFHDLTPEGLSYLEQRLAQEEQASFWDSHPTIRARMANMRRYVSRDLPEPLPAYLLVRDIDAMERKLQEQLNAQLPVFP
jgi:Zn-dependent protease with chaperone function